MLYLELVAQGVRGFSPTSRVALKPGLSVLAPAGEGAPLAALLSALCFSDGRGGDVALLAPGQKTGRAGLTIQGKDQVHYRIVRDLGGSGSLQRLDPSTRQYEPVSQDAQEIGQFLRSQAGLPSKAALERLFCFTSAQLPSKEATKAAGGAAPGTAQGSNAPRVMSAAASLLTSAPMVSAAEAQRKIAELEQELVLSKEIDQTQFRIDGISGQLFALEEKLKGGEGLKAALAEAEGSFRSAPTPESLNLPADIVTRAQQFGTLVSRRDAALEKVRAELEEHSSSPQHAAYVPPIWKDPKFLGSCGVGVALMVLAFVSSSALRFLSLLDIAAFGFAALLALKYVDELKATGRTDRRSDFLAAREKRIQQDFEAETAIVRSAMKAVSVEAPEDLLSLFDRKALLGDKVAELRQRLTEHESDPAYAEAATRHAQLKQEHERLNATLLERGGGYVRDAREVEREIAKLRESLSASPAPVAPSAPSSPAAASESRADPMPAVLALGADLFAQDVPTLAGAIRDRAVQYLAALSDKRCTDLQIDKDGRTTVMFGGKSVPAGALPPRELDLAYLALRLTLVERHASAGRVPVVFEDVLAGGPDAAKAGLLARMLKHMGTVTQVLVVSAAPAFGSVADLSVRL